MREHPAATAQLEQNISRLYSGPGLQKWGNHRTSGLWNAERALVEAHFPDRDGKILIVGSGGGREAFGLHAMGYTDIRGIDCTAAIVEIARQHAAAGRIPIDFDIGSAAALPYADESFDMLTMFENVFGHVTPHAARLQVLLEAKRVLKPGGRVLMFVTSLRNRFRFRAYFALMDTLRLVHNPRGWERGDKAFKGSGRNGFAVCSHWFKPDEVPRDAAAVGLRVALASTSCAVEADPTTSSTKYHRGQRLVYVLERP